MSLEGDDIHHLVHSRNIGLLQETGQNSSGSGHLSCTCHRLKEVLPVVGEFVIIGKIKQADLRNRLSVLPDLPLRIDGNLCDRIYRNMPAVLVEYIISKVTFGALLVYSTAKKPLPPIAIS